MSRLNRYLEKRKPKVDIDQAWSVNSSPEPSPGYPSAESVDPFTAALEAKSSSTAPLAASVVQPAPPSAVEPTPSESCEVQHNALQPQMRPNLCPDVLPQPNNKPRLDPEVMPATSPSHTTGSRVVILSNPEPPPCEPINAQSKQARQHVPLSRRFVEQCEPESTSSIPTAAEVPSRSPEIPLSRPAGIYIPGVERRPIQLPMPVGPRPSAQYVYVANMPTTISVGCPLDPYTQTLPISIGAPCYGPTISEPQYGQMHPYLVQGLNHHVGEIEYDPAYADPYYGFPSEGLSEWLAEASMGNVSANDDRPLCLDYLKGRCKQNRYKCKFAHPALEGAPVPVAQEPPSCDPSTQICEVWVLTGFCKFGSKCHFQHPPMTAPGAGVQCSPAVTKKMQEYAKRVARWRESTNDERPTIDAAPTSKTQA